MKRLNTSWVIALLCAAGAQAQVGVLQGTVAGVKAGTTYGHSDDLGYQAADGKTYCYDLHATIFHLLGIDHERLSVRSGGIDRRLTDVHGHVVREILA